ncbi:CPBP family intramembrane glutamic endopeptidase [Bacillus suaedaesalsae]|uniref:CPBP family intramembrane metalloprotease n=1 Tax=Bacillus suaedaesalsae TaxID=2810349 RepID=A0ABS2DHE4_9BACI|nr:type II CAAX endopeptidase family protein [Bacillus suaedaesalsae]MBM6617890.1 CPBP family intramembrane metalloprotease [Bacillus suaedaesalsae]
MSIVFKIIMLGIGLFIFLLIVGSVFNVDIGYLDIFFSIGLYVNMTFILIRYLRKHDIKMASIIGEIWISKKEFIQYAGVQLFFLLFSIAAITTVLNFLHINNEAFLKEMLDTVPAQETSGLLIALFNFIIMITFAPVVEELFFRGFLFNKWGESMGLVKAMILSSFIFSLLHFNSGFIGHFFLGLLFCIVYVKTKRLIVPIILHTINNAIAGSVIFVTSFYDSGPVTSDDAQLFLNELERYLQAGAIMFFILIPFVIYVLYRIYPKKVQTYHLFKIKLHKVLEKCASERKIVHFFCRANELGIHLYLTWGIFVEKRVLGIFRELCIVTREIDTNSWQE